MKKIVIISIALLVAVIFFIMDNFSISVNSGKLSSEIANKKAISEYIANTNSEKIVLVNFWATWCKPCVAEMPFLDEIHKLKLAKVVLISIDDTKEEVESFYLKNKYSFYDLTKNFQGYGKSILNYALTGDTKVKMSNTIPQTIIYKNGKRVKTIEGKINEEDLKNYLIKLNLK